MPGVSERHVARDNLLRAYKEKDPKCSEYMRLSEDIDTVDKEIDSVIESYYCSNTIIFRTTKTFVM